jgi:hypothetical protein
MGWAGHVVWMGVNRNPYENYVKNPDGKGRLSYPGYRKRRIWKWVLKN